MAPRPNPNYKEFLEKINQSLVKENDGDNDIADFSNVLEYKSSESEEATLKILEHEGIIDMRDEWSDLFKIVVKSILAFEIILTLLVGLGLLKFEDEWFLRIIVVSGFAQILTMPWTITNFLFGDKSLKK